MYFFETLSGAVAADALRFPMPVPFPFFETNDFREFYMNSRDFLEDTKGVYTAAICFDIRALSFRIKAPAEVPPKAKPEASAAADDPSEVSSKKKGKEKADGPRDDDPILDRAARISDKQQVLDALDQHVDGDHTPIALDLILAGSKSALTSEKLQSYFASIDSPPPSIAQLTTMLKWQRAYTGKITMTPELLSLMHKNPWSQYRTTVTSMPRLVVEMRDSVDSDLLEALGITMPATLDADDDAPYKLMNLASYPTRTRAAALFWQNANGRKLEHVYNAERAAGECSATWVKKCKDAFAKYILITAPNLAAVKTKEDLILTSP